MSALKHADPEDLALYAMQFLTGDEARGLALHLEHCADCRRELSLVQGDLATYSLTVEMHSPPAQVRQRVLKQVAREKKVVPVTQMPIAAFGRTAPAVFEPREEEIDHHHHGGYGTVLGWAGWALAAGLAVATTFLYKDRDYVRGILDSQSGQMARMSADQATSRQLMDALTDPAATRVTLARPKTPVAPLPMGRATYNPDKGTLIFLAAKLDPLQMYKTYELWLIPADGRDPIPAGTFHPDEHGNASVILPNIPKGVPAKAFGVTIEDDGGSQSPTLPIIMVGS